MGVKHESLIVCATLQFASSRGVRWRFACFAALLLAAYVRLESRCSRGPIPQNISQGGYLFTS